MRSTTPVHAESGLSVRRVGAPRAGSAVVVVLPPGTGTEVVHAGRLDGVIDALGALGHPVYLVGWSEGTPATAHIGRAVLCERVLPRLLDRVVRDAAVGRDGPLHLVGVGGGGTLVAEALAADPARVPPGRLVLVGAPLDARRAPLARRRRAWARSARWAGHVVPPGAVRSLELALLGPSGWRRAVADRLDPSAPGRPVVQAVSGALVADLAATEGLGGPVGRPVVVVTADDDPIAPAAVCRPSGSASVRYVSVPRTHSVWGCLQQHPSAIVRPLAGARP